MYHKNFHVEESNKYVNFKPLTHKPEKILKIAISQYNESADCN